ncbi:MAG: CvpA family protein [Thermodesulfobacteriota bacterium]
MKYIEAYNLIDLFILGTLTVTLVLGLWKGFIRSLTAVAGLVVGFGAAVKYHAAVAPYLAQISSLDPNISKILSMIIVFIAVQVVFVLIRRILAKLIDVTRLSWLDRVLGGAVGLAAGFLMVAATVQALLAVLPEWPVVSSSKLVPPVHSLTGKAMAYAPQQVRDYAQTLVEKWKNVQEPPSSNKQAGRNTPQQKGPTAIPGPGR